MRVDTLTLAMVALVGASCARRVPEPAGVAPGTPHVTWVIMYGDRDTADREFACQSDPNTECVIPASRPDAQNFSHVYLYFHGAGAETKYEGTSTIGFFQGSSQTSRSQIDLTVRRDESITNQSTIGIVTPTPGRYTVTIDVTATVTSTGNKQSIHQSIPVLVQ
jgi:hypothetical protein